MARWSASHPSPRRSRRTGSHRDTTGDGDWLTGGSVAATDMMNDLCPLP